MVSLEMMEPPHIPPGNESRTRVGSLSIGGNNQNHSIQINDVVSKLSLPGIFIFLRGDSAHNLTDPVRSATLTLIFFLHQTDGQRVPGGGV